MKVLLDVCSGELVRGGLFSDDESSVKDRVTGLVWIDGCCEVLGFWLS